MSSWRDGMGTTFTQADYNVWRAHFGQTDGSGSLANAAVPEPASLAAVGRGNLHHLRSPTLGCDTSLGTEPIFAIGLVFAPLLAWL